MATVSGKGYGFQGKSWGWADGEVWVKVRVICRGGNCEGCASGRGKGYTAMPEVITCAVGRDRVGVRLELGLEIELRLG